jgi:hypothetical protein
MPEQLQTEITICLIPISAQSQTARSEASGLQAKAW